MTTPDEMSTRQLVDELIAGGMSKAQIAKAIGRDSSVVSQITSGKKPYANLQGSLAAVLANQRGQKVPVPEAPRRLNAQGRRAQVRRSTAGGRTVHVRSAGAIKGGAKSIARRLEIAARAGQHVAWSVVYPPPVVVTGSPKRRPTPQGDASVLEVGHAGAGYPADMFHQKVVAAGGNVGRAVTDWALTQNLISTNEYMPISIELRTWTPKDPSK